MASRDRWVPVLLFALVALSASARPAAAQYVPAGEVLVAGQPVTVSAPEADTLVITYRPGSNISEVQTIALAGPSHTWTPDAAGIVDLSTPGGATQTVSVRFDRYPPSGFVMLIFAATILFGGATLASWKLFRRAPPVSPEMLTDRPDT